MSRAFVAGIARICHQANKAYCEAINDRSQVDWEDAPQWQRDSAISGVEFHLSGDFGPEASHENWMADKKADGWVYGPVKDPENKEHPCMVPYLELPIEQQQKDRLFRNIVHTFKW